MHPPVDTFEHAGLTVKILWEEYDQEHANPRDCSNLGVMFCDYRGYTLGDSDAPDPRDQKLDCPDCDGSGQSKEWELLDHRAYGREVVSDRFPSCEAAEAYMERNMPEDAHWQAAEADCERCEGSGEIEASIIEYLKREHGARVILPLFVYEHSGITISCGGRLDTGEDNFDRRGRNPFDGAGWDTSSVGVIFDTAATRKEGWGDAELTDEKIEEILRSEVEYYAAYLEGSVFGFVIEDADGEELDSCWGFLELNVQSDDAYVREQARDSAEHARRQLDAEAAETFRWACADVVTVPTTYNVTGA